MVSLVASESGELGTVEASYAFQLNRRLEFEQVRQSISGPQYHFTLRTHSLDVSYDHPVVGIGSATLEGKVGVQGTFQENVYRGLSRAPQLPQEPPAASSWSSD